MWAQLNLVQPTTIGEACEALASFGENAKVYAGGAELLLLLRNHLLQTEILVDIKQIERLHQIRLDNGSLRVGACVTHRTLENSAILKDHAPALEYAESQVANIRVRHQGTLGGNLAFNDPHSDPGTVLLIHDASVTIGNKNGERRMALADFLVDMYATVLAPDDLLLEVEIPPLPTGMISAYQRVHRYQRPTLGVAVGATLAEGVIVESRLALGCIGPKPLRLTELENKITGVRAGEVRRVVNEEKNYLRGLLRPIDDLLGSAEYKLYMACVMLGDALERVTQKQEGYVSGAESV